MPGKKYDAINSDPLKSFVKKATALLAIALSWLLFVTSLLCIPGTEFPKINWLNKIWIDKWVHIGLFIPLVVSWCWAFATQKNRVGNPAKIYKQIAFVILFYGIIMELVQEFFIPFRSFDVADIFADGIGCFGGYIIARKYIKK